MRGLVSPKWDKTARDIVLADNLANGGTNTLKGTARLVTSARLAGASEDNWFLFDLGQPVKPFINQEEVPTEFTNQESLNDDSVFEKSEFRYKAYRRGNVGYGMPELAYGSTGADAA
ncbi:MAG: Mu-like prophage major head subunit gpT family protein [Candidatus Didemnitutus sp.]|nr:Mu-like prophage major head subunit gpT family protein [Candidatus Didemnitutus sp.]